MGMRGLVLAFFCAGTVGLLWCQARGEDDKSRPLIGTLPVYTTEVSKISPRGERSIELGTQWLMSAMRPDGMIGADIGQRPDLSCMSMVGLVLVSQGNTPT